jgi:hypothetical protein
MFFEHSNGTLFPKMKHRNEKEETERRRQMRQEKK